MSATTPVTHLLVVAKAPVPGEAKTRLAATLGPDTAAALAADALLDTLDACERVDRPAPLHLALAGDLTRAVGGQEIGDRLRSWNVFAQQGDDFAARLVHAHRVVGGPVVQIGMDTPQVTPSLLATVVDSLAAGDAVLGAAVDGGWWTLGLKDATHAAALGGVAMSTSETHDDTLIALNALGLQTASVPVLRDVDDEADAAAVARAAPWTRFAERWKDVAR